MIDPEPLDEQDEPEIRGGMRASDFIPDSKFHGGQVAEEDDDLDICPCEFDEGDE